jgi:hypothetical protein
MHETKLEKEWWVGAPEAKLETALGENRLQSEIKRGSKEVSIPVTEEYEIYAATSFQCSSSLLLNSQSGLCCCGSSAGRKACW